MILLTVLAGIIIALSVWNLITLYQLKKSNKSKQEIKDDKYFELKYKLEFITTIAIVVIGVGSFFGYKVSDGFNLRVVELKTKLDSLNKTIKLKKDTINTYDLKTKDLNKRFEDLSSKITVISNKNIVKQDFFITDNLKFKFGQDTVSRFYFNRLKTLVGDAFPTFDKPPFLVIVPKNGANITLTDLNKDYFEVVSVMSLGEIDSAKFGIMVSRK
jgi:hypothetical protein